MSELIHQEIIQLLRAAGVTGDIEFVIPPNPTLGDLAFSCFNLARERGVKAVEVAIELDQKLEALTETAALVAEVVAVGPYLNFFLHGSRVGELVLGEIQAPGERYGAGEGGKGKRLMVEFAHPNTHKAFHIGHLRNLVTGESLVRLLANQGYEVIRANYQGDVGMHIAKCLYGILQIPDLSRPFGLSTLLKAASSLWRGGHELKAEWAGPRDYKLKIKDLKTVTEKAQWLGEAYAAGSKAYEASDTAKAEVGELNKKIYGRDPELFELYTTTRQWSLEYFAAIYTRLGSRFDRLYFESEVYERGVEIIRHYLDQGVFKESAGAVIFEGSKHGLHDRVFLTSLGHPTYEAKELALGELQFKEYDPERIYHVVAKEQSEYFKVAFKALEATLPESRGREEHLVYGWVRLKSGKMSSRTGQVVLGEWLLDEAKREILTTMKESAVLDQAAVAEKVAVAAVKYAFLKTAIGNDLAFDFKTSISLSGDSGPYLLYMGARIKSILRNSKFKIQNSKFDFELAEIKTVMPQEKQLLLQLAEFPVIASQAAIALDPSLIARFLFALAQKFTAFYEHCPVLKADGKTRAWRLALCQATLTVVTRGLYLLGIDMVKEM